ncbi:hypothetical protein SF83666_c00750 [Sinorhizobium fredii CCBAU 83666]|nr:hypothetical protein SF83666_c00750 [Sinorhizobium fredii CCBAU 83666]
MPSSRRVPDSRHLVRTCPFLCSSVISASLCRKREGLPSPPFGERAERPFNFQSQAPRQHASFGRKRSPRPTEMPADSIL